MRLNIVFFAFGVWLLQRQAELPALGNGLWLCALGLAILGMRNRGAVARRVGPVLLGVLWLGLGFYWAAALAHIRLADALPPAAEGRDIRITGVVATLPQLDSRSVRFEFDVERVLTEGASVPSHIALTWWGSAARDERPATPPPHRKTENANVPMSAAGVPARSTLAPSASMSQEDSGKLSGAEPRFPLQRKAQSESARQSSFGTLPSLHAGERWQLTVRLRRPHGTANPNGFDYEAWLFERNIRAIGYVRVKSDNRRLTPMVHAPQYWLEAARAALRGRIQRALPAQPYGGVIVALAVGDQRAIPPEQWQIFTRTGVNHLMSISGLHVTMVSGLVLALAYWLWRRNARLTLRLPARKAALLFGLAAALGYTLLAGFAVPAQRTLYMLAVTAVALWFGMTSRISVVLAAALFVVLLLDPWAVLAPGFWLSFGAVAVIMYVTVGRIVRADWLTNWATVQWAVTLGLVPPLLVLFQQVSIVSPLANAVAIPVVSLIVVPLTLVGVTVPFDFPLHAAHLVMGWCMLLLEWMSEAPIAVWQQHIPPPWTMLAAVIGVAWLLLPRGFPARWLGAVAFLPLFLMAPPQPADGEAKLTVLDVGQGLAVVAQTRHHALLYDTGPAFGPGADSGTRTILPYLRASGIRSLDGLIVSHDDIDHSGGAESVLHALPVEWLLTSLPDMDPLPLEADETMRCHSGQNWEWDGVQFELLGPTRESYENAKVKDNDRSCVLRIVARGGSILLPADIERRAERVLVDQHRAELLTDVLVAPHQGSKTSSTPEFVEEVNPRVVIFPVGYRNRFGHPHKEVVERYRAIGSRIYRTDRDGALTLVFTKEGSIRVEPFRAAYRRYWQTPLVGDPVPDPAEF